VPTQLLGAWFLPPAAVAALEFNTPCPSPLTAATCFFKLTLAATTYQMEGTGIDNVAGDVVVNNTEIDFFNSPCGIGLADGGVGRYTWTLTGGILHFAPVKQAGYFGDPCGRLELPNGSYVRTN
jgi:hypothetical protein